MRSFVCISMVNLFAYVTCAPLRKKHRNVKRREIKAKLLWFWTHLNKWTKTHSTVTLAIRCWKMSDFESSSNSSSGNGSSGNEADSEGEDIVSRKDMDELIGMVDRFNPYMYEPEKDISSTSSSSSESETFLAMVSLIPIQESGILSGVIVKNVKKRTEKSTVCVVKR